MNLTKWKIKSERKNWRVQKSKGRDGKVKGRNEAEIWARREKMISKMRDMMMNLPWKAMKACIRILSRVCWEYES